MKNKLTKRGKNLLWILVALFVLCGSFVWLSSLALEEKGVLYYIIIEIVLILGFLCSWRFSKDDKSLRGISAVAGLVVSAMSSAVSSFINGFSLQLTVCIFLGSLAVCAILYFLFNYDKRIALLKDATHSEYWKLRQDNDVVNTRDYNIPIGVFQVQTIPQSQESITGIKTVNIQKALLAYSKGSYLETNKKKRLIIFGDFGSGKTTSLLSFAITQLDKSVFFPSFFPVYIKLSDFISHEDISILREKEMDIKSLADKKFESLLISDLFNDNKDDLKSLWDNKKILFLFDGLNEIIQREDSLAESKDSNMLVSNIFELLEDISCKNSYVVSTCSYPDIITSQSLADYLDDKCDIYVVNGVILDEKQLKHQKPYETQVSSCVTSYKLNKKYKKDEAEYIGNRKPTPYSLLEKHVDKEAAHQNERLDDIVKELIDTKRYTISYPPIILDEIKDKALRSSCLFIGTHNSYCIKHILIYEYLLATYLLKYDVFPHSLNEESGNSDQFVQFFLGDGINPPIFDQLHIRDTFIMLTVEVMVNQSDEVKTQYMYNIQSMLASLKEEEDNSQRIKFLLLLSEIQDIIFLYNEDNNQIEPVFIKALDDAAYSENGVPDQKAILLFDEKTWIVPFKINKLYKYNKTETEKLLDAAFKRDWVCLGLKRDILNYYLDHEKNPNWIECGAFKDFCMEEYPAEMLNLNRKIKEKRLQESLPDSTSMTHNSDEEAKNGNTEDSQKGPIDLSFFKLRIREIKHSTLFYKIIGASLFIQIFISLFMQDSIRWVSFAIKMLGFILFICSYLAWRKQLWKNEEYYGWALADFSRDEPLLVTLSSIIPDTSNDPKRTNRRKHARVIIADWLKNRPSIIYLLFTSISLLFVHNMVNSLFSIDINIFISLLAELILAVIVYMVFCIPFSTLKYLKNASKKTVIGMGLLLFFVIFILPILTTTLAITYWGLIVIIVFVILGLLVFYLLNRHIFKRAELQHRKPEEDEKCLTDYIPLFFKLLLLVSFVICPVVFLILYFTNDNPIPGKEVGTIVSVIMFAVSIFLSLLYAGIIRKVQNRKDDKERINELKKCLYQFDSPSYSTDLLSSIENKYSELSCSGQIEFINIIQVQKCPLEIINALLEKTKTVPAFDALLELEINKLISSN